MKQSTLPIPNIVPGCKVQVINESTWKYATIAECAYTPKAIQVVLVQHKLESAWVVWSCGRELWGIGNQIAVHL